MNTNLALSAVLFAAVAATVGCASQSESASRAIVVDARLTPTHLRAEYLVSPLGVGELHPRLSWELLSSARAKTQSAYRVVVASSQAILDRGQGDLWDTHKVQSRDTNQIAYAGTPLAARQACYWKVKSWDENGVEGPWSSPTKWEMGLLAPADWSAQWVEARVPINVTDLKILSARYESLDGKQGRDVTDLLNGKIGTSGLDAKASNDDLGGDPAKDVHKHLKVRYTHQGRESEVTLAENANLRIPDVGVPYLRKTFDAREVVSARLYVTALGLYEVSVNGKRVGDHALAPDWTDYNKRVRYQCYDVTKDVKDGSNVIGALVAPGWYAGHVGFNNITGRWGKVPALLAQLEITHADGSTDRIVTDGSWQARPSPYLMADFLKGDAFDARLVVPEWNSSTDLAADGWTSVATRAETRELESQVMEPVEAELEVKPKSVVAAGENRWIFDLGQNMVGVARLKLGKQPAGTTYTLRFAEMLNPDNSIYVTNLRAATSTDTYTYSGKDGESWTPKFTFHGFRYVELTGPKSKPDLDAITGVVYSSATPRIGEFSCSDAAVNQLQHNIQWGQRGNYISVPTDCPQRDERLGWTADAQVFTHTATMNADIAAFMTKWTVDVDDTQNDAGAFYDVAPKISGVSYGTPAWADAGVIVPWQVYLAYGDKRLLEKHLPAMAKWIEFCREHSTGLIRDKARGNDYGDWLSIGADTPKELIGTAYFAYSTRIVSQAYAAVGDAANAEKYAKLFEDVRAAFNAKYVKPDGRIFGDTQCCYVVGLRFDLLSPEMRAKAIEYLVADVRAKGNHLSTGFVGVSYLLPVLTAAGHADVAFDLLKQDTFPSWLFSVKHGATTIWERWDGWTPEKGFQDPGMNSFNHYSLGSVGQWLFESCAGLACDPATPGYTHLVIRPHVGGGLTQAKASHRAITGDIESAWTLAGEKFTLKVAVPPNVSATVYVPATDAGTVTESGKSAADAKGVRFLRQEGDRAVFEVGSGAYEFSSSLKVP